MTNKEAYELVRADWKSGHHLINLWLYQYNRKYMRLIRKCIQHDTKQALQSEQEHAMKAAQEENAERIYAETVGEAVSLVEKYKEKGGISEYIQNLRDGIGALGGIQALRKIVPELADKLADEIGPTRNESGETVEIK